MVSLLMADVRFTSFPLSTHFCTYPRTSFDSFLQDGRAGRGDLQKQLPKLRQVMCKPVGP